ncbi:FAD-dependent monooxygenase [Nonomuraea sp. GTA35]|uniref:FAD-dependent monooxygenase n=1 Tax=Nonomuraea sp. GTA35 TaxID=1676746 RepID=UPI0035C0875F
MSEVIVVGAGPTGLLLAGDLAEAGVAVTVLERRDGTVSNLSRAFGVHARTLEQLDARGLADRLVAMGAVLRRVRLFERVEVDLGELPSRFPFLLITPQYNVERLLLERALAAGVEIVYGAEVHGLVQDGAGVRVSAGAGEYRASYVVGCDGYHSVVRQALGLPFPGKSVLKSIMLGDVRVAEPPGGLLTVNGVGDAFAFIAPFGDGYYRVFAWDRRHVVADDAPLALEELREVTRRALGSDLGMGEPRWLSRFHSDERQVPRYRVGRVFVAGDAAHVHSPAGGQGMNTGLQDAANLGWKLAAVLRGAPQELLDTYHGERYPVGRSVLRSSGALIRAAMIESAAGRAVRGFAARGALSIPRLREKVAGQLSGIGYHYPAGHGAPEGAGTRAADIALAGGSRLYEALRERRFVLLADPAHIRKSGSISDTDLISDAGLAGWRDQVKVAAPAGPGGPLTLIRPDGYIAWTGTDTTGLHQVLTTLVGSAGSHAM